jgi:hypothetical protein
MRRYRFVRLNVAALVVAFGGCRDSAGPGGGDESAVLDDVIAQAGLPGAYLQGSVDVTPRRVRCTYSASIGRFECPAITEGGVTIRRSFAFLDATGVGQPAYDPITTAAVNTRLSVDGTRTAPDGRFISEVHTTSDMTVSGLAGNEIEHIVNGKASGTTSTVAQTERGPVRTLTEFTSETINLVFAVVDPRSAAAGVGRFPKSGSTMHTARITITDAQGGTRTSFYSERVTYDGTNVATVVITTDRGTRSCKRYLDRSAPQICS